MSYYIMAPFMVYNYFLVLAAVIPAAALLIWTYKADKLEKESGRKVARQLCVPHGDLRLE